MVSKKQLQENVNKTKSETKSALQLIFDNLNQGQRKKLIKNTEVKKALRVLRNNLRKELIKRGC